MATFERIVKKTSRAALLVLAAALLVAAPAAAQDAGDQYDRALAAGCSGYASAGATTAPYQYCPGYTDPPDDPPRGGQGQYPQYPPSQYPPPGNTPMVVIADLDGDGRPESAVPVGDTDGDGAVDGEDVTAVVGDVFFVYATDDPAFPAGGGTPVGTANAVGAAGEESEADVASVADGGEKDEEATKGGKGGARDGARDGTSGSDMETVGDAERASSGGEPGSRGPGRVVLLALGAGTLLVANGLLARWIVG